VFSSDQLSSLTSNESGRFGALKSDSTHHFIRNACTKSGSLRFSQLTDFVCLYNYEFGLSLCKIVRSSVILLLPLFTLVSAIIKGKDEVYRRLVDEFKTIYNVHTEKESIS
jgi:hypothetical protein